MPEVFLDPVLVFDESFPASAQDEFIRALRYLYRDSFGVSSSLVREAHVRDLHPHLRRSQIESRMHELAGRHPDLGVRVERNRSGNTHTVVESRHISLTIAHAKAPSKYIRRAAFRETDAMKNYPLFRAVIPSDALLPGIKFSAILLHGHPPGKPDQLGFAVVRFPKPQSRGYLDDIVDLVSRFPDIRAGDVTLSAASNPPVVSVEEIPDSIEPKILLGQLVRQRS